MSVVCVLVSEDGQIRQHADELCKEEVNINYHYVTIKCQNNEGTRSCITSMLNECGANIKTKPCDCATHYWIQIKL
jgi:hypothetical protein